MIFRRIESKEMKREGTEKDEHSPSTRDALGVTRSGSLREGTKNTEGHGEELKIYVEAKDA